MLERLQKILSARGIASRRKAEEYIEAGLVTVNGKVAKVGDKADPEKDRVEVSGKVMEARQEMLYYVLYKPVGVETSNVSRSLVSGFSFGEGKRMLHDRETSQRETKNGHSVRDLLPKNLQGKIYPVGRLDKDSEGLLLLTNDGVLAYRLTHPKFDHEKEYEVTVETPITEGQMMKLRKGITISGEKTKSATVKRVGPSSFHIALTEGKNRQIRRMCQKVGAPVTRLQRVRIVSLEDPHLKSGALRMLTEKEKKALLKGVGL